jgi:hypothetical protein
MIMLGTSCLRRRMKWTKLAPASFLKMTMCKENDEGKKQKDFDSLENNLHALPLCSFKEVSVFTLSSERRGGRSILGVNEGVNVHPKGPKFTLRGQSLHPGAKVYSQGPKFIPRAKVHHPWPKFTLRGKSSHPRAKIYRHPGPRFPPRSIKFTPRGELMRRKPGSGHTCFRLHLQGRC